LKNKKEEDKKERKTKQQLKREREKVDNSENGPTKQLYFYYV
jgi:hypothetical protein